MTEIRPIEQRPLGGLLIGGKSRRLGQPKQLVSHGGLSLAERAHRALTPWVDAVVLLGAGEIPSALSAVPHWPDDQTAGAPTPRGPLAGMLTAFQRHPDRAWIFAPCDLPHLEPAAVEWLIAQRRPGRWAVFPSVPGESDPSELRPQPLLALYEPPARKLLEGLLEDGFHGPSRLASESGVAVISVPDHLVRCWRDLDTPDDLASLDRQR